MRIQFLGTGAAEGWPAVFCDCQPCQRARQLGGKDIRTRSSLHINQDCKIDLPPDTYLHVLQHGLQLTRIQHLLITHAHLDHLEAGSLAFRAPAFSHRQSSDMLHVYGNERVFERIRQATSEEPATLGMEYHLIRAGDRFQAGRLNLLALPADHAADQEALLFVIEDRGVRIWQAFDTGFPPEAAWDLIKGLEFDALIMDCTSGPLQTSGRGHMSIEHVQAVKQELEERGQLRPGCRCIATHFSHNGACTHEQLQQALAPAGIEPAYDGMVLEL